MAKYTTGLLEEELKNKVAADWFAAYDTTRIIGKVDFCVAVPATELGPYKAEVDAKECFASHFMSDFLAGKGGGFCENVLPGLEGEISHAEDAESAEGEDGGCANALRSPRSPREIQLSPAARAVLDAGRELWRYYHAQPGANPNASYYDIRRHFQGMKKTASGKEQMNATSDDVKYNNLLAALKSAMKKLAKQIEPKVYAYGFLKK